MFGVQLCFGGLKQGVPHSVVTPSYRSAVWRTPPAGCMILEPHVLLRTEEAMLRPGYGMPYAQGPNMLSFPSAPLPPPLTVWARRLAVFSATGWKASILHLHLLIYQMCSSESRQARPNSEINQHIIRNTLLFGLLEMAGVIWLYVSGSCHLLCTASVLTMHSGDSLLSVY